MEIKSGRTALTIFIAVVLFIGTFSGGLLLGWVLPREPLNLFPAKSPTAQATAGSETSALEAHFSPLLEAWDIVHENFIYQPLDDVKLVQGAIRGMLDSLGDKHTSYMTPEEYEQANAPLVGSYGGIGAYVDTSGDCLTILNPMPGSPAERAGLKPGDQIIAVDHEDVSGLEPDLVLTRVRGEPGTTLILTVRRGDPPETLDFTIVREVIKLTSVEYKMLDQNIAYISLSQFAENTNAELIAALEELLPQNPRGLILDLRYNGGGYLDTAVQVVSQFIKEGVVLYEELGDGTRQTYRVIPGGMATDIKLVVLVNDYSASASEITAGAIQDYERGVIVGTVSYGKGSVQNWVALADNAGAVRITIAKWLTPKERQIDTIGITPDVEVQMTDEDFEAGRDPQLDKAVEIILSGAE